MILDEPFRGLDALTRELMQEYCAGLLADGRRTTLFVTTDIDEALLLADRLLVMTNRPTRVRAEVEVDLARPRTHAGLLDDPQRPGAAGPGVRAAARRGAALVRPTPPRPHGGTGDEEEEPHRGGRRGRPGVSAATGFTAPQQASRAGASKVGDPITLTVGYQPYYTEAWSGLVMRQKQFWKKYLPKGSQVNWEVGLQGSIIVGQMLAGKEQIGYLGDMPAIVGASKRSIRDLRIVGHPRRRPGPVRACSWCARTRRSSRRRPTRCAG